MGDATAISKATICECRTFSFQPRLGVGDLIRVGLGTLTMVTTAMTGTWNYVRNLVEEFSSPEYGVGLTVLANSLVADEFRSLAAGGVTVHCMHEYRVRNRRSARLAALGRAWTFPNRLARAAPANVDLVHYPLTVPVPATHKPTVLSLHDVQHHDLPSFFSPVQRLWRRHAYDDAARRATTVMTISEHSKSRISECLAIAPERIEVAYLGVDSARFASPAAENEAIIREFNLPDRFVVYPAALWPHKNHLRLIQALAMVGDPKVELVLTGPVFGGLSLLLAEADRVGVRHRVRHLGFIAPEMVAPLLQRATALVFPSLYEGFGIPVIEAMAAGCPVAAAAIPTLVEVCGDAAVLFDPMDPEAIARAVEDVLTDVDLRQRISMAGDRRAACFTWRACAERHVAIYERTLERMGL